VLDEAKRDEAKRKWVAALHWMQVSLVTNEAFWQAVKAAVIERKALMKRLRESTSK
jgi:hypothetical protein